MAPLFAAAAHEHYEQRYAPAWRKLFLREGESSQYPMPAASAIVDGLSALSGVQGSTVHSNPPTSVTEGLGYAMFVAGMQKDLPTLKSLTVGWQANGQAFGGQEACGGCCPSSDQQHVSAKESCASATLGGLCRLVPGAYMPGWRMPMGDSGSMGSATDADEDAITGLIYLAELLDDDEVRTYAVKVRVMICDDVAQLHVLPLPAPSCSQLLHLSYTPSLFTTATCLYPKLAHPHSRLPHL